MSQPAHDETHDAHDAHDDAAHAQHEPDEAIGEPKTPLWLTALGGALFLALGVFWLASRPADRTLSELTPPAPSASQAQAAPPPPPEPTPPPQLVAPPPSASVAAPAHKGPTKAVNVPGKRTPRHP
jgi:hypothetical protein